MNSTQVRESRFLNRSPPSSLHLFFWGGGGAVCRVEKNCSSQKETGFPCPETPRKTLRCRTHGCCWEIFCIFASCGLVVEIQPLNCNIIFFGLPCQRQPRTRLAMRRRKRPPELRGKWRLMAAAIHAPHGVILRWVARPKQNDFHSIQAPGLRFLLFCFGSVLSFPLFWGGLC